MPSGDSLCRLGGFARLRLRVRGGRRDEQAKRSERDDGGHAARAAAPHRELRAGVMGTSRFEDADARAPVRDEGRQTHRVPLTTRLPRYYSALPAQRNLERPTERDHGANRRGAS